jgi:Protein of unknown function (DUF2726)
MPIEIIAILIGIMLVGGFVGRAVERASTKMRRQAWREKNRRRWESDRSYRSTTNVWEFPKPGSTVPKQPDAADQLRIVMGAKFSIQPLLNKREARVFRELDRIVISLNPEWQVMAQVSVGEILHCQDEEAYRCINSKRIDLLLVDGDCNPRHAVEYQGGGHYQGSAAARDAVKKEALRRAGIGYHEVVAGHTTPSDLRQLVEKLVDRPAAPN